MDRLLEAWMKYILAPFRFIVFVGAGILCLLFVIVWHITPADWFLRRG